MDANSLKAFLTIVDQGSFSEAAETLHLTQPAISKRLAALETPASPAGRGSHEALADPPLLPS